METRTSHIGNMVAAAQVSSAGVLLGRSFGIAGISGGGLSLPFVLTLSNPIDDADSIVLATIGGTTAGFAAVTVVDDVTIDVNTLTAAGESGAKEFQIAVFRYALGTGERP